METIMVTCPNGHKLSGTSEMVGHRVRCPKCSAKFELNLPPKKTLTETGVMRILGKADPLPSSLVPPSEENPIPRNQQRRCPRCHQTISIHANVCEHCKCYAGVMPTFLSQMIAEGKSLISVKHG